MSAPLRQHTRSDAAAEELWCAAESGDLAALDRICSRGIDVNARNKFGMTALMRAAYHGHAQMVRALVRRGADPNLARNDKFTALALAAFFGHTETVRILIEHGAKTEVITRCGASAKTWAIARTFDEAARCLESVSAPEPAPVLRLAPARPRDPVPAPEPAPATPIRTLKDPPEIWDLVHEVPRGFNPRSAFVARLKSMRTSFALGLAVIFLVALSVVGTLVVRRSRAHSLPPQTRASESNEVKPPGSVETTTTTAPVTTLVPEVSDPSPVSAPAVDTSKPLRKTTSQTRATRSRSLPVEETAQGVESREVPAPPATVASPRIDPPSSTKPNTPLSPQVISPAKSAPPKGKVIQWP
ncbi:MAG TPA: ankyrin repeat domain-containing protein [Pyrinomonadaceae bacterium]